jgi:adenine-specific DNA-methyltransferase
VELDTIVQGDCLEVMAEMPENSVDLIVTDPPYFRVKGEWWDRQWDNATAFLDWLGQLCAGWQRILKPNGSLYVFASPQMADRVSVKVREWFNVLNRITWSKPLVKFPHSQKMPKEKWRRYYHWSEIIIFAEHYGADSYAKGEAGYSAKCDELRGFVFEPLRAYLVEEWTRAGLKFESANEACGTASMAARHYFARSQWCLPTEEHYHELRAYANSHNHGGSYLRREYEDLRREYEDLRREYEDLRREYEDLRRPFNATATAPFTDVWHFDPVPSREDKHPCEKPLALIEHIIRMSSTPGAVVFDGCMGSGTTAEAAFRTGRRWFGCDIMQKWVDKANARITAENADLRQRRI